MPWYPALEDIDLLEVYVYKGSESTYKERYGDNPDFRKVFPRYFDKKTKIIQFRTERLEVYDSMSQSLFLSLYQKKEA